MQKVIILSNRFLDFIGSDGKPVKGRTIRYIDCIKKNDENFVYSDDDCKIWIKPEQSELELQARALLPGEVVELQYSIEGRRAFLSGITSTGELAVDFDKIFN